MNLILEDKDFDIVCTNFKSCTSMRVYKNVTCFSMGSRHEVSSSDHGSAIRWYRRKQNASTSVIFLKFSEFCFSSLFKFVSEYTHLGLHIMADLTLPLDESILRIALSISLPSSLEWLTYTSCLGIPTSNQQTSFFVGDNLLGQKSFANTGAYIGFVESAVWISENCISLLLQLERVWCFHWWSLMMLGWQSTHCSAAWDNHDKG